MGGVPGRSAGEEFSAFDGHVTGRQIELVPGERIVQAWRFPQWAPGTYSMVSFTLTAEIGGTRLVIDQRGEPDDWHEHLDTNWPTFYLTRSPPASHRKSAERMPDHALLDRARSGDEDAFAALPLSLS